jgi:hypothetical protein
LISAVEDVDDEKAAGQARGAITDEVPEPSLEPAGP